MTTLKRTPQKVRPAGKERRRLLIQDDFDFKPSPFHALGSRQAPKQEMWVLGREDMTASGVQVACRRRSRNRH
jgi:hypothetical protein